MLRTNPLNVHSKDDYFTRWYMFERTDKVFVRCVLKWSTKLNISVSSAI